MRAVLILFVVCLISKDLAFAPFPYALRGLAQALCLLIGCVSIVPHLSGRFLSRYWPILGYIAVLFVTIPFAKYPFFVLLQVLSLLSAIVFFTAYLEQQRGNRTLDIKPLTMTVIAMYGFACLLGLLFAKLRPDVAYGSIFAGNLVGDELRFRGLFSKSSMMGAAAGLLIGFAAICVKRWPIKLVLIISGLACLVLTQSRTFWLAAFAAGVATAWVYYPRLRRMVVALSLCGASVVILAMTFNIRPDIAAAEKFARLDSLTTLTGRTALWSDAMIGLKSRPWFGYGFTLGATGLSVNQSSFVSLDEKSDPTQLSKQTMHNGYIQCLLDTGVIGFLFYGITMILAVVRLVGRDRGRKYPEVLYALLFLIMANAGESVVYSGSIFQSLCFWLVAVFALGLTSEATNTAQAWESRELEGKLPRFANLMN